MGKIVVGVDASPGAKRALAWAAAEAQLRHAVLQVVHAYHARELAAPFYFPSQHALPGTAAGAAGEPSEQEMTATLQDRAEFEEAFHGRAEQLLDTMLSELEEAVSGVDVQRTVVEDRRPAEALVELSTDAARRPSPVSPASTPSAGSGILGNRGKPMQAGSLAGYRGSR